MGTAYNTNVVTDGLIACWDAANRRSYPGTGTTWTDLVLQNAGSMSPSPTFESDKAGVMSFDGTDDIVTINSSTELSALTTGDFSFEAWVNVVDADDVPNRYVCVISLVNAGLILMGHSYPTGKAGVGLLVPHTNPSYENLGTGFTSASFSYGEWVHVACTRTGTTYSTYINGVGGVSTTENGWWDVPDWKIGKGYSSHFFYGDMGAIRVYNRVLTPAEVSQNYEAMKPRFAPRIAKRGMNLNFDAGDPASYAGGTSWKDTANGLSTTFHNMDASNFNSSNGGYFDFDGTDEWMTAPHSPLFQSAIADQGTFAAWFNIDAAEADNADVPIWSGGTNGNKLTWSMAQFHSGKKMHLGAYLGSWMAAATTDTALSYDTWYYVVFTWDKANTQIKSYINGALDDTDTTSSTSITTSSTGALGIGASLYSIANSATPNDYLNGFIGVLQLYDSVLSAAEILDNYQKTKARFGH